MTFYPPPRLGGALGRLARELAADTGELRQRAPHVATRVAVDAEGQGFVRELYGTFDAYNVAFFSRELAPPLLLITYTAPRALADHAERDPHGLRSVIRIHPRTVLRGFLFTADILLHEMVHTWAIEVAGDPEPGYRGHGPRFASMCTAIGMKLGLGAVGVKRRKGLPDCAQWPVCVRPRGYYENEAAELARAKVAEPRARRPLRAVPSPDPSRVYADAREAVDRALGALSEAGGAAGSKPLERARELLRELAGGAPKATP